MKQAFMMICTCFILISCSSKQSDFRGMYSEQPAQKWQDALVSGNGVMGILVFGDPANEQIIFNHEFCYEPIGTENVEPPDIAKYLPKTRELLLAGQYQQALLHSYNMARGEGYPGLLWTDPYHPAFVMNIDQPVSGDIREYKRAVNFETGEVDVTWVDDNGFHQRQSFVSRPDQVVVQKISGTDDINLTLSIDMQKESDATWFERVGMNLQIEEPIIQHTNDYLTFRQKYKLNERGYEAVTKVILKYGEKSLTDSSLVIKNARDIVLLTRINYLENFDDSEIEQTQSELSALSSDYDKLLASHVQVHGDIFNRVRLDLGSNEKLSSEEFIQSQKNDPEKINPALLQTMFDMGRYTFISSSGKNPPNLMGLWNGEWRPAWSGDFTLDANINLQIAAANLGNVYEGLDSYHTMLERIAPDWEINAKKLYGCNGYLGGTRTSGRRNLHTHFHTSFPGHFWLAAAEWLLLPSYEYYQVSGDEKFLTERLLPMMLKTVEFFEDFLVEIDENGNYIFAPSYSPENWPGNQHTASCVNATMDIAAAKEAITNLIFVCEKKNILSEKVDHWKTMLDKMPPYLINSDGALKEWTHPDLEDRYDHRHVSHLYPVWPGLEINPEETPELFQAAIVAAEKRGRGNGSAHGLAHMALIGARLKMAELVHGNLLFMMRNDYLTNSLFTYHNPGRIYNSDALHSLPAVILEALVYSRPGVIELLPAWADHLATGSISGVRCRTQATVEKLVWDLNQRTVSATISSLKDQQVKLMFRRGIQTAYIDGNKIEPETEDTILIELKKDQSVKIELSF